MIDITEQERLLVAIGKILPRKINIYAIGGTSMMLRGLKNSTLDIDFVFDKQDDREEVMRALKKLGAKETDATLIYVSKKDIPTMLKLENCRFDMFMNKIIASAFSDAMKKRANQTHEFGNLIVKAADPNDIIILKSATSRGKDIDDIIAIINKSKINWSIIVDEAENQVKLGNERAILNLGEKLEILSERGIPVPKEALDNLWKILKKKVNGKIGKNMKSSD